MAESLAEISKMIGGVGETNLIFFSFVSIIF